MSNFKRLAFKTIRHPYITQACVSGVLQFSGDFITQKFIEKKEKVDRQRSMNFFLLGCCTGIVLRKWYGFLSQKFTDPRRSYNTVKKVAVNELLFTPAALAGMTVSAKLLQNKSVSDIKESFKKVYWDILMANYKLWPLANFVNFYFVPLKYQVGFNAIVAFGWNTYFSYKVNFENSRGRDENMAAMDEKFHEDDQNTEKSLRRQI